MVKLTLIPSVKFKAGPTPPLTEKGLDQARQAKKQMEKLGLKIDQAYSSTSGRAIDTLHTILGEDFPNLHYEKDLRELSFGRLEGESHDLVPPAPFGDQLKHYGGEGEADARARFYKILEEIMQRSGQENVLVVSHGMMIRYFRQDTKEHARLDIAPQSPVANCSIHVFEYDGQFRLLDYLPLDG